MFGPPQTYLIEEEKIPIIRFYNYANRYVKRPPYQRKNVWDTKKRQKLLDSLFRRYYIPRIVLREVRIGDEEIIREVVDGQQRIATVQRFFEDELRLPESLENLSDKYSLGGKLWSDLNDEVKMWVEETLTFTADNIKGIDGRTNREHHKIAAEVFSRLQEGEDLNLMERMHARLSSIVRNIAVKYADDITFDFDEYKPLDNNPDKHCFFGYLKQTNERMQHLLYFIRFLILEYYEGKSDVGDNSVMNFVLENERENGIGVFKFNEPKKDAAVENVLGNLTSLTDIIRKDVVVANGGRFTEFRLEYILLSFYLLVRHIRKYYYFPREYYPTVLTFAKDFHKRWNRRELDNDTDFLLFADARQHDKESIMTRDRIIRGLFFKYAYDQGIPLQIKARKRYFDESERIEIYRRDNGLCQLCVSQGKREEDCKVPWEEYEADHIIPHLKGGATGPWNAQVLHKECNRRKGAKSPNGEYP